MWCDVLHRCDTQCGCVCICAALKRSGLSAVRALTWRNMSSTHRSSSAKTSRAKAHEDAKSRLRAEIAERGQLMFDKGEMSRWIKASESRVVRRTVRDSRGNASAAPSPEKVLQVIAQRWREALLRRVVYEWRKYAKETRKLKRLVIYKWRKFVDETPITYAVEKIFLCYAPVREGSESVPSSLMDDVGQRLQSQSV